MRALDEPIPADEQLFRSVHHTESDGMSRDPTSIDLPASSVSRSKYAPQPEQALRRDDTGVAVTTPGDLPPAMGSPGGIEHEVCAEDDPQEGDAHAEIRVRRTGQAYDPSYRIKSKPFRLLLRREIAARFRMVIVPCPPTEEPGP
jgi:hypothetical protein